MKTFKITYTINFSKTLVVYHKAENLTQAYINAYQTFNTNEIIISDIEEVKQ